jgi:NMD protein affecting ribosome stability and mRNA decay
MTEEEIRAWLATLCSLCGIQNRRTVEATCTLCGVQTCSIHRSIYGETVVCLNCYHAIQGGRRAISVELRALMDESRERIKALFAR